MMNIEIKNLNVSINKIKILKNINMSLSKGHIYGIIGRNGSGKSVLLKTICGFVKPISGSVYINGEDIYKKNIFPTSMRALINRSEYIDELSGLDNLKLLASIQNKIKEEDIIKSLDSVNMLNEMSKKFKCYSLGMKQKIGICDVIMENPDIMIFDEPFNGIDDESVKKISNLIKSLKNDHLIIITTHIKDDIDNLCDIVYKMDDGQIK